ncbi:zinc knuckle, partial [Cooperia oncophora]
MSDDEDLQNSADRTENVDPNVAEEATLLSPMAQLLRSKAADREKLQERRRMILAGQEPMENIQRTPRMTSKAMGSSSNGQQGQFHSLRTSSSSSDESELSLQSELSTARLMNEYMRAAAMPDVKPFANRKGEKFTDFLRQFRLKYPETTWRDSERRDILVGLLEGEARMHYKTLPKDVRNGSLQTLIEGMKRRLKGRRAGRASQSYEKTPNIRKKGDQSVLQFCLELETLSCKAYPNADDHTLSLMRAEILQEQLSHWTEAIQLLEILETETSGKVYEKMRETALRIERLRENSSLGRAHRRHWDSGRKGPPQGMNGSNKAAPTPDKQDGKKFNGRAPQRTQKDVTCTNCGKRGHEAQECWSKKSDRQAVSFSATLDTWCCKTIQSKAGKCVEVGSKYMVTLTCLGSKESGLIDSGSQITIIPLEILKRARDRGQDMDRLCTQVPLPDVNAYDASGNRMDFLGCVQLNLGLEGRGEHPVRAYVKKLNDNVILLGTNVLRTLGIHTGIERCTSTEDEGCTTRSGWQETLHPIQGDAMPVRQDHLQEPLRKKSNVVAVDEEGQKSRVEAEESSQQEPEKRSREATVVKRVYVSPGQCALIQVQGNGQQEDAALCSVNANIPTGVCEFSQNGTTEVPVLNHTSQPIVFQEGQKIGVWEEVDWIQAATKDIESD